MASFLYYGLGESIVDDATYDKWCRRLAKRWHKLDRLRQWQLGSPDEIRSTGYHVKVTHAVIGGAWSWMMVNGTPLTKQVTYIQPWNRSKRYMVEWLHPEHFRYGKPMKEMMPKPKKKRLRLCQNNPKRKRKRLRL